jgi:hypothetical protein
MRVPHSAFCAVATCEFLAGGAGARKKRTRWEKKKKKMAEKRKYFPAASRAFTRCDEFALV